MTTEVFGKLLVKRMTAFNMLFINSVLLWPKRKLGKGLQRRGREELRYEYSACGKTSLDIQTSTQTNESGKGVASAAEDGASSARASSALKSGGAGGRRSAFAT